MYNRGEGVLQDYTEAVRWYRLAAERGNAAAQYGLGFMYAMGRGVTQNDVYAHMWWNIAAVDGNVNAINQKDMLNKYLTPQDISKAQDLARECVKKNYKGC